MGKSRKSKRVFKKPLTKAELEGAAAYGLSREMPPHQRLEFAKAMNSDVKEGDLSFFPGWFVAKAAWEAMREAESQ